MVLTVVPVMDKLDQPILKALKECDWKQGEVHQGRVRSLKHHEGEPIPWFVAYDDEGVPQIHMASEKKYIDAIRFSKCWTCGGTLGANRTFLIGAMSIINRVGAEPPSHRACAEWWVRYCSTRPHMSHRKDFKESSAGVSYEKDGSEVLCLWSCRKDDAKLQQDGMGGVLFSLTGDPFEATWWKSGRPATREEVVSTVDAGWDDMAQIAAREGLLGTLERMTKAAEAFYPK